MRRFAALFLDLDATTATSERIALLEGYFREASDEDAAWAVAVLGGERPIRFRSSQLRAMIATASGLPEWLVRESYATVGDLAETASLLCSRDAAARVTETVVRRDGASEGPAHQPASQPAGDPPTERAGEQGMLFGDGSNEVVEVPDLDAPLAVWMSGLASVARAARGAQEAFIIAMWRSLPRHEAFVATKLLTGALRIGVSRGMLAKALARVAGVESAVIDERLLGLGVPDVESYRRLVRRGGAENEGRDDRSGGGEGRLLPVPFHLASPLEDAPGGDALGDPERVRADGAESSAAASAGPERLGPIERWLIEWKWDGIRAQLLRRSSAHPSPVALWTRGEEIVTDRFPELVPAALRLPEGTIVDGEIVAWREGRPLGFNVLQTRIARRRVGAKTIAAAPTSFIAFDLLMLDGLDLRERPLWWRRSRLESLVQSLQEHHDSGRLLLSPQIDADEWNAVAALRQESRERGVEGMVIKALESTYRGGRLRGAWWKWKIEPFTVDAVLVGAEPGHGRRATLLTDYTFALREGDGFVPVAKAYSGLSDEEIRRLDQWIRSHTIERHGPVRMVAPELVFELAFEGVQRSDRHRSGVAVRFPRILRWRHDRTAASADELSALKAMIAPHREDPASDASLLE